jgi:stalled ribosome alternative rescue factor ArfA
MPPAYPPKRKGKGSVLRQEHDDEHVLRHQRFTRIIDPITT